MMTRKNNWTWGQKLLLIALIITLLLFGLNFLLTYIANRIIQSADIVGINTKTNRLNLHVKISVFPYFKLGFTGLEYSYKNKPVVMIEEASAHLSFFALFKKRLHIYDITIDKGVIDLTNFPKMTMQKESYPREHSSSEEATKQHKELPPATLKTVSENAFNIDHLELNNIRIIYATSAPPLYFEKITITRNPSDSSFIMNLDGQLAGKIISGSAGLYPQKEKFLDITFSLGQNVASIVLNDTHQMLQGNVRGSFSDPQTIEQLFLIPTETLPNELEMNFLLTNNKITVSPIKIYFPKATISANLSQEGTSPINVEVNIPMVLLTTLSSSSSMISCPIPNLMTKLLKGFNTHILFITESQNQQTTSAIKTSVSVEPSGIKFDNNLLPPGLEQILKTCFDYQLQDEDSVVIYHF
ncbi:hypothetical protein [Legionella brunensis]|uniref:AsmA family protein n=1 Tax=Legionella brunensis TaxID=29422 RepID=A0A0W0S3G9_9GAMM|nr:hypothetical protein [Legionella brunensis]KTC77890.1 AsmA family protein [Legionella brunensis]